MVSIAVMGHGVVGSGVVEVLSKNQQSIDRRAGEEIRLKYVLDLLDFPGLPYSDKFIKDFNIILNDPEIEIVVEVMEGSTRRMILSNAACSRARASSPPIRNWWPPRAASFSRSRGRKT